MAKNFAKISNGVNYKGQASAPSSPDNGDIYYDSTRLTFVQYVNGFWIDLASKSDVASASSLTSTQFTSTVVQSSLVKLTGSTTGSVHGLASSTSGKTVMLYNSTAVSMLLKHQSATEGTAANRITTSTAGDVNLAAGQFATLVYDGTAATWVLAQTSGSSGSGTGINYITNGDAESGITGFATYADAAGTSPVDGTGGSPSSTFTTSTSSPLRSLTSFLWTKSANNRQGEGFSFDFTLADADKGKVLAMSMDYAVASGTYADDDMQWWLYDKTNSVLIPCTPYKLKNHTLVSDRFFFEVQMPTNSSSYRLICHTASTSALAYTLKFDNLVFGPQAKLYGSVDTDPISYTPVFTGFGTVTAINFNSCRIGAFGYIYGTATAGTPTGVEARVSLPSGWSTSSTLPTIQQVGHGVRSNTGNTVLEILAEPSVSYLTIGVTTSTQSGFSKAIGSDILGTGATFSFFAKVLIQGFSSSQLLSSDADTRVIAALLTGNPASATSGNVVIFPTSNFDTHGAFSTSTGRYTVPVSGYYRIMMYWNATNSSVAAELYIDGVTTSIRAIITQSSGQATGNVLTPFVKAGQIIDIRPTSTTGAFGGGNFLSFEKVAGPSQIAASEKIAASYYLSANFTSTTTIPINYDTKIFDTHGTVTTSATAWKFTAPVTGFYNISLPVLDNNTAAIASFAMYKNGSQFLDRVSFSQGADNGYGNGSASLVQLNAGEYIDIRAIASTVVRGGVLTGGSFAGSNTARIDIWKV